MLPDPGQQLDLSKNGGPEAAMPEAISAEIHTPTAAQEPGGSSPLLPRAGGEVELMEGYCYCARGSRQREREPGGTVLREQSSLQGVGQSWLPGQTPLSGVRLMQGSVWLNPGWEVPVES